MKKSIKNLAAIAALTTASTMSVYGQASQQAPIDVESYSTVSENVQSTGINFNTVGARGGFGYVHNENSIDSYFGGVALTMQDLFGQDTTLDFQINTVLNTNQLQSEVKGRATLGSLVLGAGFADLANDNLDTQFFRAGLDSATSNGINYNFGVQVDNTGNNLDLGTYASLSTTNWHAGAQLTQEQFRADATYIFNELENGMQPAISALYVNNEIGNIPGPNVFVLRGTAGYTGGYMSPLGSESRAFGGFGTMQNNPISLMPITYNRIANTQDIGDIANFSVRFVNGEIADAEALVFLGDTGIFAGPAYNGREDRSGIIAGWKYDLGNISETLEGWNFNMAGNSANETAIFSITREF